MVLRENLLTAEQFLGTYADQPYELLGGRVINQMVTGYLHGAVTSRVAARLVDHVDEHQLGDVVGADAAFISQAKLVQIESKEKVLPFAPDLAVEVVSPSNSASEIQSKVKAYLEGGAYLVWVIYPDSKQFA